MNNTTPNKQDDQAPKQANWLRFLPPLLAFALVAVLGMALVSPSRNATAGGPLVGKAAPTFELESLEGAKVSLSELKGRPVVVNFWASWCGPCREEAPLFRQLSSRQDAQGLVVLGVLFDGKNESNDRAFIDEYALAYANLKDPQNKVTLDYGVAALPETFFIDSEGIIQHKDKGGLSLERLNIGLKAIGVAPL